MVIWIFMGNELQPEFAQGGEESPGISGSSNSMQPSVAQNGHWHLGTIH